MLKVGFLIRTHRACPVERRIAHNVIEFGCSYGKLKIDDIEVELSHGGGSTYDFTDTWCFAGKNKYASMKYLVDLLTKKISLKVA